jgi:hypothetical protein
MFDLPRRLFDAWERPTAQLLERLLRSPRLLEPFGALVSGLGQLEAARAELLHGVWAAWGLPTRREQERTLHLLQQLESRLLDLEETLAERR